MRKHLTLTATAAVLALALAAVPKVAQADDIECGDTLTSDTTLHEDLTCTTTSGLIIGADGITVDLNGFTLTGETCGFCHGIRNGDFSATANPSTTLGFDDVTIKNGTIVGFEQGIRGDTVLRFIIKDMEVRDQTTSSAIDILHSEDVTIKDTTITISADAPGTVEAIRLESVNGFEVKDVDVLGGSVGVNFACAPCPDPDGPSNGVVKDSSFTDNGNGILIAHSTDATVKDITVTNSGGTGILVGLAGFIGGFPAITNVTIKDNTVTGGSSAGIQLITTTSSKVWANTVTGNADGGIKLRFTSINNRIKGNTATGNTGTDMLHDGSSTPNNWKNNICGVSSGADIDCP